MNTLTKKLAVFALGALAITRLDAAIESIKIHPGFALPLSPVLLTRGVTEGEVKLVIAVSAEGQLTDWLALGYTDRELVRYFVDTLKTWAITPARFDGRPVAVQVELTASVTAQGVVVSRTSMEITDELVRRITGNPVKSQLSPVHALDRLPARLVAPTPQYAKDAEKQGVRGKVQVHFYIDEHGAVRMPSVEPGAQPYLAGEAVAAVRGWKFEPPTRSGKPVLVAASQEFNFGGRN